MGLKFNPLLNNGFDFTGSGGGGGGVTSVNGISGAVTLAAGTNITLVPAGSTITINSTGGSTTPAGANKQVQFNNSGAFGAAAGFEYDSAKLSFKSGNAVNVASGFYSTALGSGVSATGNYTLSVGGGTLASADYSVAIGTTNTASGIAAFSLGNQSLASGDNSVSGGIGTIAQGYAQVSIGAYNVAQGSNGGVIGATDNILIVGNGTGSGARKNAFTISNDSIMKLYGSTSGFVGQKTTASPTSYTVTWPGAQGSASTVLTNDGSGNLSWAAGGSGANTALSNLTSPTAVNQHLIAGINNTFNIGSTSIFWNTAYINELRDSSNIVYLDTTRLLRNSSGTGVLNFSGTNIDVLTRKIVNVVNPTAAQDAATKAYVDAAITFNKENITLTPTDITNQYVDLAHLVKANSLTLAVTKTYQIEGDDYILSTVGLITRLTFNNDLATGGVSALVSGNILNIQYSY